MATPLLILEPPATTNAPRRRLNKYWAIALGVVSAGLIAWPAWSNDLLSSDFLPHRFCYLSNGRLVSLHLISDSLIFIAYTTISIVLTYLVYRARRDIPFRWVFLAFGMFIVACGFTHFMEIVVLWKAVYWLAGEVKLVTAIASVLTAAVLPPLVPKALAMVNAAKVSEDRRRGLEQANRDLAALNARLTELDALKSQFFANVSHELRTPLMLIETPAERLASLELGESERGDIRLIQRNARQLRKHVDDLLDAAKLEAGRMQVQYEPVDLAELMRLQASNFQVLSSDRGMHFIVAGPESLRAQTDPDKLSRIVLNLLSNAFKFTPSGGRIRCQLNASGMQASFTVEDSGPGIPAEIRKAVFERFRQLEGGATRRFGGTGLGLSIVKEFVQLLQGSVEIDESPLGGARFTVTLPLHAVQDEVTATAIDQSAGAGSAATLTPRREAVAAPAQAEIEALASATPIDPASLDQGKPETDAAPDGLPLVLLVEDSLDLSRFIARALASQYRVVVAHDGVTAMRKAMDLKPDLIMTDIMMPGMSGEQFVAEVRRSAELDEVPIMVVTAKADEELRVDLLKRCVQDYLVKPFSLAEMHARTSNLISFKRARNVLQQELQSRSRDVVELAQELARHRRWALTTLNSIGDAVLATDSCGRIQFVNRAAESLLEVSSSDITGRQLIDVVCLEDDGVQAAPDSGAAALGSGERLETYSHVLTTPGSGAKLIVEDSLAAILDPDGTQQGVVMVLRDITQRRAAEEALRRSERLVSTGRTAATIAHEINNPLEAVTNLVFLVKSDPQLNSSSQRYLEMANEELERIAHMTKQTLGFYRDSSHPTLFNISATIESVLAIYSRRIGICDVNLEKQLDSDAEVFGSPAEFRQVFANLLLNALDAMSAGGGHLVIRARRQRSTGRRSYGVRVSVADTGKGIPFENKKKIFEAFYTTKNAVGMGLGLWLSQGIVEKHGGTIRVRSRTAPQRSGTIFSLFWPSAPDQKVP